MNALALTDRFLPPDVTDPDRLRQLRSMVLGSALGLFFATFTAMSYLAMGSAWSASSITLISVGLLFVPMAIRRGVEPQTLGHLLTRTRSSTRQTVSPAW